MGARLKLPVLVDRRGWLGGGIALGYRANFRGLITPVSILIGHEASAERIRAQGDIVKRSQRYNRLVEKLYLIRADLVAGAGNTPRASDKTADAWQSCDDLHDLSAQLAARRARRMPNGLVTSKALSLEIEFLEARRARHEIIKETHTDRTPNDPAVALNSCQLGAMQ
jgi:hypothetical protein